MSCGRSRDSPGTTSNHDCPPYARRRPICRDRWTHIGVSCPEVFVFGHNDKRQVVMAHALWLILRWRPRGLVVAMRLNFVMGRPWLTSTFEELFGSQSELGRVRYLGIDLARTPSKW